MNSKFSDLSSKEANNSEYEYSGLIINGFVMLLVVFVFVPLLTWLLVGLVQNEILSFIIIGVAILADIIMMGGFCIQEPNQARVCLFFGKYCGSVHRTGYFWMNPFFTVKKLSLRIRNMDIDPIKVNDKIGNPVMIGMVLVWKIRDTYRVVFDLDAKSSTGSINQNALDNFVRIQSDAALREVTSKFAYDPENGDSEELTLRNGGDKINELLEHKINERLSMAGVEVVEARINYLAYAPEIAAVMLRRQQASAIISAREKIVEGAVSMVDMALKSIEDKGVVKLDNAARASMVSNLLVVLCADEPAQPMLNATA